MNGNSGKTQVCTAFRVDPRERPPPGEPGEPSRARPAVICPAMVSMADLRYDAGKPILLSTNKAFSEWSEVFPHAACVVTLFNRLIRRAPPASVEDARKIVGAFVDHYNNRHLHSAIGFITPADTLRDRRKEIWAERDRKLEAAREARRLRRAA